MSANAAGYPAAVWDGVTPSRSNPNLVERGPDSEDWEQITAELIAAQTDLFNMKYLSVPNAQGGAMVVGTAVYLKADGSGGAKADANGAEPLAHLSGLVKTGTAGSGGTLVIQRLGRLTLTTAEWDTICGTTGGLTAYTEYFLSGTAGALLAAQPTVQGDRIVRVGVAISATVMDIQIIFRWIDPS